MHFFLLGGPTCPSFFFFLNCHYYIKRSTRGVSLKVYVGFSISDSFLFLLKFTFLFNKKLGLFFWNAIIPFKIKITEKAHTILLPDCWFFNLEQKILNFSNIWVSWSSPKIVLETNWNIKHLRTSMFSFLYLLTYLFF